MDSFYTPVHAKQEKRDLVVDVGRHSYHTTGHGLRASDFRLQTPRSLSWSFNYRTVQSSPKTFANYLIYPKNLQPVSILLWFGATRKPMESLELITSSVYPKRFGTDDIIVYL